MIFDKPALPSDLKDFSVKIDGQDISDFVNQAVIYQDVFNSGWTCELHIRDMNNIVMNIPIRPGSDVEVTVETKQESPMDDKKTFKFQVSHIADKQFQNYLHTTYTLHCIDKDMYINTRKRVSKSYSKKKHDQIIDDIVKKYLDGNLTKKDSSDYKINIIIPNLSPLAACNLVMKTATKDNRADFLLFQEDQGNYVFKSFEKLYKEESSGFTFKMRPSGQRDEKGAYEDYCVYFSNYHFVDHTDGLLASSSGWAASKLVEFDFIKKKWVETPYKYSEEFEDDREKAPWKSDLESPDSNIVFRPLHKGLHENDTILDHSTEWSGSRKSNLLKFEADKLILQVPGGVKGWTGLGKNCEVELPSQQDKSKGEEFDRHFKGKYLIAAICHMISKTAYFVNYELCKKRAEAKWG